MNISVVHNLRCRVCKSDQLALIHDFGIVPVADKLISSIDPLESISRANLSVSFCTKCALLQINEDLEPEHLFNDNYPYFSSKIPEVAQHFKLLAEELIRDYQIGPEDYVVEIAGNDGVFLKNFVGHTTKVVNIEPSSNPAKVSLSLGIETHEVFFNFEEAKNLKYLNPKLVFAANVLAHVPDPNTFVKGLAELASNDTVIVLEVPHLLEMVANNMFDVIFHQHFSYFSLKALKTLFNNNGLYINDFKKVNIQGGALRLYINKQIIGNQQKVNNLLIKEQEAHLDELNTLHQFGNNIVQIKNELNKLLAKLKLEGKKIAGYGAPGKAATLLNYFGISKQDLDYLVDISPSKQGKIFPFTELEIFSLEKLHEQTPDYLLILVWNYKDSIMAELSSKKGLKAMKYITFFPQVKIVS